MNAAPVADGRPFVAGPARTLFQVAGLRSGAPGNTTYEVTRDGQRFLLNQLKGSPAAPSISVILNWAASP